MITVCTMDDGSKIRVIKYPSSDDLATCILHELFSLLLQQNNCGDNLFT
jgi:hypothetical protein